MLVKEPEIKSRTISFASKYNVLDPSTFESIASSAFEEIYKTELNEVVLDFRSTLYIDVVALINLSAYLNQLVTIKPDVKIKIGLPQNNQLLRFLCTWNFRQAIENAIERKFYSLISNDDGERYEYIEYRVNEVAKLAEKSIGDNLDVLSKRKQFAIRSFKIKDHYKDKQLILDFSQSKTAEWHKWEIKNILDKYVTDINDRPNNGHVGNNIFFECITNSLRHPKGSILQTTSKFTKRKRVIDFLEKAQNVSNIEKHLNQVNIGNFFTLVFWDNGRDMVTTLKAAKQKFGTIRSSNHINKYPKFKLNYKDDIEPENSINMPVDSKIDPDLKHHKDYYWLLSTFFPGITCDPKGENYISKNAYPQQYTFDRSLGPGMGLNCLLDTTINSFQGKIVVRTHCYRMILEKGPKGFDYSVSIRRKKGVPLYNGNLIAVHLPINDKEFNNE